MLQIRTLLIFFMKYKLFVFVMGYSSIWFCFIYKTIHVLQAGLEFISCFIRFSGLLDPSVSSSFFPHSQLWNKPNLIYLSFSSIPNLFTITLCLGIKQDHDLFLITFFKNLFSIFSHIPVFFYWNDLFCFIFMQF